MQVSALLHDPLLISLCAAAAAAAPCALLPRVLLLPLVHSRQNAAVARASAVLKSIRVQKAAQK